MKYLTGNKNITTTLLFLIIVCVYGGNISEAILVHTPLAAWISASHITNAFNGADFSLLPVACVLATAYLLSAVIFGLLCEVAELWGYFSTPPANANASSKYGEQKEPSLHDQTKTEPSVGDIPSDEKNLVQKDIQP
ncbi:hypothetical protein YB29_003818 [Salmonella enterica subsp. enterica]|nr:hypothetical protein [Salmonella enterica subsp. enterica]EDV1188882.1 hypothetical protein [Salmonella enterica subsp. enterica]